MIARQCPLFPSSLALAVLLGAAPACSSADAGPASTGDAAPAADTAPDTIGPPDPTPPDDVGASDAIAAEAPAGETKPDPKGSCPACQAGKCSTELKACAGSSACVDWLTRMNECFKQPDVAACQAGCREGMNATAKKMDDCTEAKCHTECTP